MNLTDLNCICEELDLDMYIEFRDQVKSQMLVPDWLGDFSKADLVQLLSNGAKIWLYKRKNIPICSMMLIPAQAKDLLKFELNLDYKEVADYGPMFVNKEYRGMRLQYKMMQELDRYCLDNGYKYAVATVHPDNIYSINNLMKDGFILTNTKKFKRGMRSIYLKILNK